MISLNVIKTGRKFSLKKNDESTSIINRFLSSFFLVGDGNYWRKLRCDRLFLWWEDLVVPSIRKEPNRADESLEDQLFKSSIHTTLLTTVIFMYFFLKLVLKISQQLNVDMFKTIIMKRTEKTKALQKPKTLNGFVPCGLRFTIHVCVFAVVIFRSCWRYWYQFCCDNQSIAFTYLFPKIGTHWNGSRYLGMRVGILCKDGGLTTQGSFLVVMFALDSCLDSTVFILTNHCTIYIITMVALPSHAMNQ